MHFMIRDYEPAAVIIKIIENSHSRIDRLFFVGGPDTDYDYCITSALTHDLSRALRDEDFFHGSINEWKKNHREGAELKIPRHGKIRIGYGTTLCLTGTREL